MSASKGISAPCFCSLCASFCYCSMCHDVGIAVVAKSAKRAQRKINKVEHLFTAVDTASCDSWGSILCESKMFRTSLSLSLSITFVDLFSPIYSYPLCSSIYLHRSMIPEVKLLGQILVVIEANIERKTERMSRGAKTRPQPSAPSHSCVRRRGLTRPDRQSLDSGLK